MKLVVSLALLLALAPGYLNAAADDPGPAVAPTDAQAAAIVWLKAKGIECSPDRFVALAATAGKDCLEQFLNAGLDPNTRDSHGTPALVSVLSGWKNLKRPEFNPYRGKLENDRLEVLELLLTHGADPNLRDRRGFMAIHHAASYEPFWPAIARLKQAGADLETRVFGSGLKPLYLAVTFNNPKSVWALLQAGATPGDPDPELAPLVNAIKLEQRDKLNRSRVVEALLRFGADVKIQSQGGESCLHLAAEGASIKTIQALLDAGADRTAKNGNQMTPYDSAKANNRGSAVLTLLEPAS
jgi:ankyrin repeat protein